MFDVFFFFFTGLSLLLSRRRPDWHHLFTCFLRHRATAANTVCVRRNAFESLALEWSNGSGSSETNRPPRCNSLWRDENLMTRACITLHGIRGFRSRFYIEGGKWESKKKKKAPRKKKWVDVLTKSEILTSEMIHRVYASRRLSKVHAFLYEISTCMCGTRPVKYSGLVNIDKKTVCENVIKWTRRF